MTIHSLLCLMFPLALTTACVDDAGVAPADDEDEDEDEHPNGRPGVGQITLATTPSGFSLSASFVDAAQPSDVDCTQLVDDGVCQITACGTGTAQPLLRDAGQLTFSGGALPAGGIAVQYGEMIAGYYVAQGTGPLFAPNDTMRIESAGGEVPAFELTVTAPAQVTLASPVVPALPQQLTITRANGLTIEWDGGLAGDEVHFGLTQITASPTQFLTCTFAADAGQGVISAAVLALLSPGNGVFSAGSRRKQTTLVAGWQLFATASQPALTGATSPAQHGVVLQ